MNFWRKLFAGASQHSLLHVHIVNATNKQCEPALTSCLQLKPSHPPVVLSTTVFLKTNYSRLHFFSDNASHI